MNVTMNSGNTRFSSMRAVRFASAKEEGGVKSNTSNRDQVTISQEGRDNLEVMVDKTVDKLSAMTKEEFIDRLCSAIRRQCIGIVQPHMGACQHCTQLMECPPALLRRHTMSKVLRLIVQIFSGNKRQTVDRGRDCFLTGIRIITLDILFLLHQLSQIGFKINLIGNRTVRIHIIIKIYLQFRLILLLPLSEHIHELDKIAKQAVKEKLDALIKEKEEKG